MVICSFVVVLIFHFLFFFCFYMISDILHIPHTVCYKRDNANSIVLLHVLSCNLSTDE